MKELISILNNLRSLLSESAQIARKPVQRKLNDISNDAKSDPELLAQISNVVTKCNISAYKTRALMLAASLNEDA